MTNNRHLLVALSLMAAVPAMAHHSSSMYDETTAMTVVGTVAKVEWVNPHITIWVYVPNAQKSNGYELYGFQSGSINLLSRQGWSKDTFKQGEKVTVEYFPLKDGRPGGSLIQGIHPDGSVSTGDPLAISLAEFKRGKPKASDGKSENANQGVAK